MGSLSSLRKYCITIVLFGSKDKSVWENMGIEDSELKSDSESPFLDVFRYRFSYVHKSYIWPKSVSN